MINFFLVHSHPFPIAAADERRAKGGLVLSSKTMLANGHTALSLCVVSDFRYADSTFTFTYIGGAKR